MSSAKTNHTRMPAKRHQVHSLAVALVPQVCFPAAWCLQSTLPRAIAARAKKAAAAQEAGAGQARAQASTRRAMSPTKCPRSKPIERGRAPGRRGSPSPASMSGEKRQRERTPALASQTPFLSPSQCPGCSDANLKTQGGAEAQKAAPLQEASVESRGDRVRDYHGEKTH